MSAPLPGWFPDPWQQGAVRWWEGTSWTGYYAGVAIPRRLDEERCSVRWLRWVLPLQPIGVALSVGAGSLALRRLIGDIDLAGPASVTFPPWIFVLNLLSVVGIVVLIVQVLWLHRAAEAARSLGIALRREPGLTAAGWIIPIVNFWWPYQGMRDLFPDGARPASRIAWWWGCFLGGSVFGPAAIVGAFLPATVNVGLVALAVLPMAVAAGLQWRLVGDAVAVHEQLAGVRARA